MKVVVAFIPPMIWLLYFWDRESFGSSRRAIVAAFICGMALTYPVGLIQDFLFRSPGISFDWFYALMRPLLIERYNPQYVVSDVIYGGFVEESLKLVALLALCIVMRPFVRPAWQPMMGVAVGSGFVVVENALHYFGAAGWQAIALLRSLTAAHVFYGAIMGSFLALGGMGRAKFVVYPASLIFPLFLHGASNIAISINVIVPWEAVAARAAFLVLHLASVVLALWLARRVSRLTADRSISVASMPQRLRGWAWCALALALAILGMSLTILSAQGEHGISQMGATFMLGLLAIFYALLFAWRGRASMRAFASSPIMALSR